VDVNFFEAGGHSLLLVRVLSRLKQQFGTRLTVRDFLAGPTVRGLAANIEDCLKDDPAPRPERIAVASAASPPRPAVALEPGAVLHTLAMPTCDRPTALRRAVSSYLANAREYGHHPTFVVMDNSTGPASRRDNVEVLRQSERDFGVSIRYADAALKRAYAMQLADQLGTGPDVVRFALEGDREGSFNAANNANAALLDTVGDAIFCADDDTVCDTYVLRQGMLETPMPHDPRPHTGSPEVNWAFASDADLMDAIAPAETDVLREHGRLLAQEGVVVTVPSLMGDCGWGSPAPYLRFTGASLARLIRDEHAYEAAVVSRLNLRFVKRETRAAEVMSMMSTFYGADNRALVPPFLPCTMGSDVLFALIVSACHDGAPFAYHPAAIRHAPIEPRAFWPDEVLRSSAGVDFSTILAALIRRWRPTPVDVDPASRLQRLGHHLAEVGALAQPEYDALVHRLVVDDAQADLDRLAAVCADIDDAPPAWRRHQERHQQIRSAALADRLFAVPLDLALDRDVDAARALGRRFVSSYGHLLVLWPSMRRAAVTLRDAGIRVSVSMDKVQPVDASRDEAAL
jgi:hypothetical protein